MASSAKEQKIVDNTETIQVKLYRTIYSNNIFRLNSNALCYFPGYMTLNELLKTGPGLLHCCWFPNRTLTAVHDAILEDLVFPAEIVGKRIRIRLDGSKLIKVHLDKTQQTNIEHKTDTFAAVYKKLTGKEVTFEFPEPLLLCT
ncbi:UNVERIFIED_CONTAM: RpS7 [Trichonephila clavipes]